MTVDNLISNNANKYWALICARQFPNCFVLIHLFTQKKPYKVGSSFTSEETEWMNYDEALMAPPCRKNKIKSQNLISSSATAISLMASPGKNYVRTSLFSRKCASGAPHTKQRDESSNCLWSLHSDSGFPAHPDYWPVSSCQLELLQDHSYPGFQFWPVADFSLPYHQRQHSFCYFLQAQSRKWPAPSPLLKVNFICSWSTAWELWYKNW